MGNAGVVLTGSLATGFAFAFGAGAGAAFAAAVGLGAALAGGVPSSPPSIALMMSSMVVFASPPSHVGTASERSQPGPYRKNRAG
jgi:hypothetical protein